MGINEDYESTVELTISMYQKRLYKWASLINSLACIVLDGKPTSNDLDLANDAIKEVNPYLGLDEE